MDTRYMDAVSEYIKHLATEVVSLQCTNGGPILMVQAENEYGSYGNDRVYMDTIRQLWKQNGITVPFYTADGPTAYMLETGSLPGAAIGLDSGSDEKDFNQAKVQNNSVPVFSSETYPGWLTHWGEKWARPDTTALKNEVAFLLQNKKSFNFYVIHGGTNFGFTAGANAASPTQYQPDLTSYDYDAPINEHGAPTAKYYMLRNLITTYTGKKPSAIPAAIKMIETPDIELKYTGSLWQHLPKAIYTPQPKPLEAFDQNQGLILYRTKLIGHKSGKLKIWEPHDYALVFLNGVFIDTVFRDGGKWDVDLPKTDVKDPVLDILVEGMGHINFAQFLIDRKGITDRVTLNGMTLMQWETYLLPMDETFINDTKSNFSTTNMDDKPCKFFKGTFTLNQTGDTYFDLRNYTKGMLYVNGHNLGRFWNIGPQQRLYCPASWLKRGVNEIIVFDFHQQTPANIAGFKTME